MLKFKPLTQNKIIMNKQELFGIITGIVLLIGSFTAGVCYAKLQTIHRAQEVLQKDKLTYTSDDIKYITIGEK